MSHWIWCWSVYRITVFFIGVWSLKLSKVRGINILRRSILQLKETGVWLSWFSVQPISFLIGNMLIYHDGVWQTCCQSSEDVSSHYVNLSELILWAPHDLVVTSLICVTPWADREQAAVESWPAHTLSSQVWDLCDFTNVSQLTHRELTTNSQCDLIYLCRDESGVWLQNDVALKYFMWDSCEFIMISPWHHCEIKFFTELAMAMMLV